MKKKIALLLAAIMTMSLLPVNVFAASTNRLSRDPGAVAKETLLFDETLSSVALPGGLRTMGTDNSPISESQRGLDLVFELKDDMASGDAFRLVLTNAEWYFDDAMDRTSAPGFRAYDTARIQKSATEPYAYDYIGADANYTIRISSGDRKSAVVSLNGTQASTAGPNSRKLLKVPVLAYIKDEGVDVKLAITDNGSHVTSGTYLIATSRAGSTTTTAASIKSGRENIQLDTISIKENRTGSFKIEGGIELIAPSGYFFTDKFSGVNRVVVANEYGVGAVTGWSYAWTDVKDHTSVALYVNTASLSTNTIPGAVTISGLEIEPLDVDRVLFGETLNMTIGNYTSTPPGGTWATGGGSPTPNAANKLDIKQETFPVAKAVDWTVAVTAESPKSLISGRFPTGSVTDDKYKTAKISFNEEEVGAWLADRTTTFTLPENVKIMAVKFDTITNLTTAFPNSFIDVKAEAGSANPGKITKGAVTIDENVMTFKGVTADSATVKSKLEFTLYVSIEPNFAGPITLETSGTSLPQALQKVTIAQAKPPIVVTSRAKDVQIGYQKYSVSDIVITETESGALTTNGDALLKLKVDDYTKNQDLTFSPITDANFKVTSGDIKLSLKNARDGIITFNVDRQSRTASTIELTGLDIKINRSVPYGKYDIVVFGDSLFNNYAFDLSGNRLNSDLISFDDADNGIVLAGYINVVTEGANASTTNNVKITANSNAIMIGDKSVTLDVAPFIDPESNSFLVPVRFVATALGVPDTNILWDSTNKQATIISPTNNRTIQFTAGSDVMAVNGARQTMVTNTFNVKAKIVNDRMFIPFRYVGLGLGIASENIKWTENTKTAEFNPIAVD